MRKTLQIMVLCTALTGCVTAGDQSPESATASLSFEAGRSLVLAQRGFIWKDAGSIRDASIGRPYSCTGGLAHIGDMPNVCLCVEVNARNGFGGYTGIQRTELLINGTRIVDAISPPREPTYSCGPMTPFPELNAGYVPQPAAPAPRRQAS